MKQFVSGLAAGMVVSAAVTMACMPKKADTRKRIGNTLKTMVNFVDDLGEAIRG